MVCWMIPRLPVGGNDGRPEIIGEERHVVVGRVEIRVIEDIERVEVEAQAEAFVQNEFLAQDHIEAHLERSAEDVAAGVSVERFV